MAVILPSFVLYFYYNKPNILDICSKVKIGNTVISA